MSNAAPAPFRILPLAPRFAGRLACDCCARPAVARVGEFPHYVCTEHSRSTAAELAAGYAAKHGVWS